MPTGDAEAAVTGSESAAVEGTVPIAHVQKISARLKELSAHIKSLEEQLEEQTASAEQWQRHCEELQQRHAQELAVLEAKLEAGQQEAADAPDPLVCPYLC